MRPHRETETGTRVGTETSGNAGRLWAYGGTILGGTVSIAANVSHAWLVPPAGSPETWKPQAGSVVMAFLWPVMLFVVIEVIIRNRFPGWTGVLKWVALPIVAGVVGVISYLHMSGLFLHWRSDDWFTGYFGPLVIDGLMLLCSGSLLATKKVSVPVPVATVETVTETPEPIAVPSVPVPVDETDDPVPVRRIHRLPVPGDLPEVSGLTRNRVSQVMAIRAAVPELADRERMTWADCGRILSITGKGALQKIHGALRLMDAADTVQSDGGELECSSL